MGIGDQQKPHGPNLAPGPRLPSRWRILTDATVDDLAEQVGVPGVAPVLLDEIAYQSAQAGVFSVVVGNVNELIEPAMRQGRGEPGPGPLDRVLPERIELRGGSPAADVNSRDLSAPEEIRTPNLLIRSQMLYPLSYGRMSLVVG